MNHSRLTGGVQFKDGEDLEQLVRRALRDAYAAGCEAMDTRSLFTAGQWADREAPKVVQAITPRVRDAALEDAAKRAESEPYDENEHDVITVSRCIALGIRGLKSSR